MLKRFRLGFLSIANREAIFAAIMWAVIMSQPAQAASPVTEGDESDPEVARVAQALLAETEGDLLTRQRLLLEAEYAGDYAPAKWHRGKMQDGNGNWASIADGVAASKQDMLIDEYERRRANSPDNLRSHFVIAAWCGEQGLFDQCRSHLHRALEFDPDNSAARRALGYVAVGREWISPEQLAEVSRRSQVAAHSVIKYGKQLRDWRNQLDSPNIRIRQRATTDIMQLQDVEAVPAVEAVFAATAIEPSQIAVDWLGQIDAVESSKALSRYSLFHPHASIRQAATGYLTTRPPHDFVPDLLALLSSPVSSMLVPVFDRNGTLSGYRQAFGQETFDKQEFLVIDREFARATVRLSQDRGTANRPNVASLRDMANSLNASIEQSVRAFATAEALTRNVALLSGNDQVQARNGRIAGILSQMADRDFSANAKDMWDWWDNYNETQYQAYKPARYQRSTLVNSVPTYAQPSCECFVAGTRVVTQRGMKVIERVAVGDCVLSQNVRTGELAWKPVLRSTTRPPESTRKILSGEEVYCCTGGHLFWVSGKGWSKASEIEPGNILHAAEEPVVVTGVEVAARLPTFNLEVADNHVYFVGENMVLTHDVTPRRHTRQLVPGQDLLQGAVAATH